MTRNDILLTGLAGLVGAVLATALCLLAVVQGWVTVWFSQPYMGWISFIFLALFSLAEIPLMLFGIRQIAKSSDPNAKYIALFVNAIYVLFAAIYAAPHILLTGDFTGGLILTGLSLVRFLSAGLFLPYEQQL